jgi:hypothetical protein
LWIGALALIAFVLFLLARFPAAWALGTLPAGLACDAVDGTVWNGTCTGLMLRHRQLIGDLAWQLHPLRLFLGRVAAHVELTQAGDYVNADVEVTPRGRHFWASAVHANVHLNPALMPQLPNGLRGVVRADLASVELDHGRLADLQGHIEAHDLVQGGANTTELGNYALTFAPTATRSVPVGELHDLGGPLDLSGRLRVTADPGFLLDGTVAPRPTA